MPKKIGYPPKGPRTKKTEREYKKGQRAALKGPRGKKR